MRNKYAVPRIHHKVLLDTSVFDNKGAFAMLNKGRFSEICSSGKISFYPTARLVEEICATFIDYQHDKNIIDNAKAYIQYIIDNSCAKWFDEPINVFEREFSDGVGEYWFMTESDQMKCRNDLLKVIETGKVSNIYKLVKAEQKEKKKKEVKPAFKYMKKPNRVTYKDFQEARDNEIDKAGKELLGYYFPGNNEIINKWQDYNYRNRCIYFMKYVEGLIYAFYFSEETKRGDVNASADMDHLIFLIESTKIVSNEGGCKENFMKRAAEELFPEKDYILVKDLDNFLNQLDKEK